MLSKWEIEFCKALLETGEILREYHDGENHQYTIKYDDNNIFHITKDAGEWIYIFRTNK